MTYFLICLSWRSESRWFPFAITLGILLVPIMKQVIIGRFASKQRKRNLFANRNIENLTMIILNTQTFNKITLFGH